MNPSNPSPAAAADPTAATDFAKFLALHEGGELNNELTDLQREMNAHLSNYVLSHGGKPEAELSLKIKFKLDGGIMHATAVIDQKLPKEPRNTSIYFIDSANRLTKRDPKQTDMFRDVGGVPRAAVNL